MQRNTRRDPLNLRQQEIETERDARSAKIKREQEIADFKWLTESKQGRRFLWRLLEKTGVYRSSFTGSSETFFLEGQRNIGLLLVSELNAICPDVYSTMLKEQKSNDN